MREPLIATADFCWELELSENGGVGLMSPFLFGASRRNFPKSLEDSLRATGASIQTFSLARRIFKSVSASDDLGVVVTGPELSKRCIQNQEGYLPLALIHRWSPGQWQVIEGPQMLSLRVSQYDFCTFAWKDSQDRQSQLSAIMQWAKQQPSPSRLCELRVTKSPSEPTSVAAEIAQSLGVPIRVEPLKLNARTNLLSNSQASQPTNLGIMRSLKGIAFDWKLIVPVAFAGVGLALINNPPQRPANLAALEQKAKPTTPGPITSPVWRHVESLAEKAQDNGMENIQSLRLFRDSAKPNGYRLSWDQSSGVLGQNRQQAKLHEFEIDALKTDNQPTRSTPEKWQKIAANKGVILEFSVTPSGWKATGPAQPISRVSGFLAEALDPNSPWQSVELNRVHDGLVGVVIQGVRQ